MVVVVGCADSVTDKEAIADTSVGDIWRSGSDISVKEVESEMGGT